MLGDRRARMIADGPTGLWRTRLTVPMRPFARQGRMVARHIRRGETRCMTGCNRSSNAVIAKVTIRTIREMQASVGQFVTRFSLRGYDMVTAEMAHPPAEKLNAFGLGRLDDAESAEIEAHLATCVACRRSWKTRPPTRWSRRCGNRPPRRPPSRPNRGPASLRDWPRSSTPRHRQPAPRPAARSHQDVPAELRDHPRVRNPGAARSRRDGDGLQGPASADGPHRGVEGHEPAVAGGPDRRGTVPARGQGGGPTGSPAHRHGVRRRAGRATCISWRWNTSKARRWRRSWTSSGPLPVHRACEYVRQAALGLQYAHERGMVHRDIKPQNLVLTQTGQVKVFDFGLARFVSESGEPGEGSSSGRMLGSPDYMAPEQAKDAALRRHPRRHLQPGLHPVPSADRSAAVSRRQCGREAQPPTWKRRPSRSRNSAWTSRPACSASWIACWPRIPSSGSRRPAKWPRRWNRSASPARLLAPAAPPAPAAPHARVQRRRTSLIAATALLLLLGATGLFFAGPIYRFVTDQGTLVIETNDPDVEVIVKQGGRQITIVDTKTGREVTLKAGEYQLELAAGKEGLKLSTTQFRLTRGGKQIASVRLKSPRPHRPPACASPTLRSAMTARNPPACRPPAAGHWRGFLAGWAPGPVRQPGQNRAALGRGPRQGGAPV